MKMKTFDLKEMGWTEFKFEVIYSKRGVARIYIGDRATNYTAGGYGYDKESSVIANMINDLLIDNPKYNKNVYGNYKGRSLSHGVGFHVIKGSFETKRGNKLEKIYSGMNSDVYYIKINPKLIENKRDEK